MLIEIFGIYICFFFSFVYLLMRDINLKIKWFKIIRNCYYVLLFCGLGFWIGYGGDGNFVLGGLRS